MGKALNYLGIARKSVDGLLVPIVVGHLILRRLDELRSILLRVFLLAFLPLLPFLPDQICLNQSLCDPTSVTVSRKSLKKLLV